MEMNNNETKFISMQNRGQYSTKQDQRSFGVTKKSLKLNLYNT